jgi:hypothetical protein
LSAFHYRHWVGGVVLAAVFGVAGAQAQSAIEHHTWQDRGLYEPISTTARAITGAIVLWGNPQFAQVGSTTRLTFEAGASIDLESEGASWREWSLSGGKQNAEVFRIAQDPGELLNGNSLCGDSDAARYLVFSEDRLMSFELYLQVAIFSGAEPPFDINSEGLCGTYSYMIPIDTHLITRVEVTRSQ